MGLENVRIAHDAPQSTRAAFSTVFDIVFNVNT
jgi:hypothetical protein